MGGHSKDQSRVEEARIRRKTVSLIRDYHAGNDDAFTQLYEMHHETVRRSVACRLGWQLSGLMDIDDILQQTFEEAWECLRNKNYQDFQTTGRFRNLLVKIARQKIIDANRMIRSGKRDRHREEHLGDRDRGVPCSQPRPSEVVRGKELEEISEAALLRLPEEERGIIDCRLQLGMEYVEIAADLGIKPANAKLRYSRAKRKWQRMITAALSGQR